MLPIHRIFVSQWPMLERGVYYDAESLKATKAVSNISR